MKDYYENNITSRYDDPNMQTLAEMVDPYFYRDRLTMPKLVANSGQDEFQQPDDTHYWWNDMPEPKHFMMMPNTDHSCALGIAQLLPSIGTWYSYLVRGIEIPKVDWTISNTTGDITATVTGGTVKVKRATVWSARTCGSDSPSKYRRDFRLLNLDSPCACGRTLDDGTCLNQEASRWTSIDIDPEEDGSYIAHIEADPDGRWTAFFIGQYVTLISLSLSLSLCLSIYLSINLTYTCIHTYIHVHAYPTF